MLESREVLADCHKEFRRLLREYPHKGDPCIHCGVSHDDVSPGPCIPHLISRNNGSIGDAMKSFAAKEHVVREGLHRIKSGIDDIAEIMTPAQRFMVSAEIERITLGVKMIQGVYE